MLEGMNSRGLDNTWIGGNDIDEEGTWKWTDGGPFEFSFWASGEPNSYGGIEEDCMQHGHNGKWNDLPCSYASWSFLCSKKKTPGRR